MTDSKPNKGQGKRKGDGGSGGGDTNNKKARYLTGKGTGPALPSQSRGLLITCFSGMEDRTGDDMCRLIEEHYDKLVAKEGKTDGQPQEKQEGSGEGSKDISALIAAEVSELKDKSKRRFHIHHTGVKGTVFITFPAEPATPGPLDVAVSLCEEAQTRKVLRCRFVNRVLPVTHTCFAGLDEMKAMAPKLVTPAFPEGEGKAIVQYAVDYEHRSSDKLDRLSVINAFVDHVPKVPAHKVNLTTPDQVILVQVTRNAVGASVVTRYKELHKFNMRKCADAEEDEDKSKSKDTAGNKQKEQPAKKADQPASAGGKAEIGAATGAEQAAGDSKEEPSKATE